MVSPWLSSTQIRNKSIFFQIQMEKISRFLCELLAVHLALDKLTGALVTKVFQSKVRKQAAAPVSSAVFLNSCIQTWKKYSVLIWTMPKKKLNAVLIWIMPKKNFKALVSLGPLPSLLGNLVFSLLVKTFSRCLVSFTALEGESLKWLCLMGLPGFHCIQHC